MADTEGLEKVQQKAVRSISGLKGKTYEERLAEVGLPSLRERRKEIDMVQTFKIVRDIDEIEDMMEGRARYRPQTRQNGGMDNLIERGVSTSLGGTFSQ